AGEGGTVPPVQGDDLPVEDGLPRLAQLRLDGLAQLGELGEGGGEVLASAAGQTHPIAEDGRDDAHAVPLHLVRPFVLVVDVLAPAEGGEHRGDRLVHLGRRLGRGGGRIRRGGGSLRRPVVVGPAAVGPV